LKNAICVIQYKHFRPLDIFIRILKLKYVYKKIILPVVLYGCKTWSLKLREECRLRVFEKRILI
jgi:hypothetical protein